MEVSARLKRILDEINDLTLEDFQTLPENFIERMEALLTVEEFEELYDYATKNNKHDALIIDNHNRVNKDLMFRKNWNIVIKFVNKKIT
jgi:hypothetical protein